MESAMIKKVELQGKASNPDKLLDSIIQSRCLTKDQERADSQKDKLASCKTNKLKNLVSKDDYVDTQNTTQLKYSRKGSRIRKSMSSSHNRREEVNVRKDEKNKEEKKEKDGKVDEDIDKPWISYLRNLRIPMMCQLHRKITVAISESSLKATPPQSKKRDKSPVSMKKRNLNRNPNCNHNSKFLIFL